MQFRYDITMVAEPKGVDRAKLQMAQSLAGI